MCVIIGRGHSNFLLLFLNKGQHIKVNSRTVNPSVFSYHLFQQAKRTLLYTAICQCANTEVMRKKGKVRRGGGGATQHAPSLTEGCPVAHGIGGESQCLCSNPVSTDSHSSILVW